jgi:hypothetical protein
MLATIMVSLSATSAICAFYIHWYMLCLYAMGFYSTIKMNEIFAIFRKMDRTGAHHLK